MSEHLTRDSVARYLKRSLARSERSAADEHLGKCEDCRRLVSDSPDLQTAFEALREDLKAQAERGLSHLEYEQLEAYIDGTLSDADCEIVESHAEQCGVCGGELRDLQSFHLTDSGRREALDDSDPQAPIELMASAEDESEITGVLATTRHGRERREMPRTDLAGDRVPLWRFPRYLAGAGAIATIVIAIALFTTRPRRSTPDKSPTTIAQSSQANGSSNAPPLSASLPKHGYAVAPEKLETPATLSALIGKTGTLMGGAGEQESFLLVKPVGTFVLDVRPEFRWQPLAGATEYRVGVFDADLKAIETSPALTATTWKSSLALQRGKVYVWQVTAAKGSEQVVAPVPPAPEAKFEIIDQNGANDLLEVKSASLGEHFKLGRAYARAGLLDEAEKEFKLVVASDPNYSQAQRFLADLRALRHP